MGCEQQENSDSQISCILGQNKMNIKGFTHKIKAFTHKTKAFTQVLKKLLFPFICLLVWVFSKTKSKRKRKETVRILLHLF